MHGEINTPGKKRLLDFLGEQALAADFSQATVLHPVSGRADCHDLDGPRCGKAGMCRDEAVAHESGLAQRHRTAAGADAERVRQHAGRSNPLRTDVPLLASISMAIAARSASAPARTRQIQLTES